MPHAQFSGRHGAQTAGTVLVHLLVLAVFGVDMLTTLGFSAGMLYVPVVLLAFLVTTPRQVALVAGVAFVLTIVGALLSAPLSPLPIEYVVANRFAACLAIASTGWIGATAMGARRRLEQTNDSLREARGRVDQQTRMLEVAGEVGQFGGWSADVRNDTLHWSDEVARIHGLDPAVLRDVGTGISYYVPEDRPRLAEAYARCVRDGTPFNEEFQLTRQSDGALRWVNAIGRAQRDEYGEVAFVHGALQDITDRIDAQLTAEANRSRLEKLGANMPFVIWTARSDGALDYLSEEFWRVTGILPGDALGDAWLEALHPDDRDASFARWQRSVTTGDPYSIEFRVRDIRAGYRWHYARATPEQNAAGQVVRWWGSSIDVHDVRVLQDEATALATRLNDTLESIGGAVLSLDTDWRVTFVNAQGERLLRHARTDLLGRNIWTLFPEAIGSVFQREYERAVAERRPVTFGAPFEPLDLNTEVSAYPHDGGLTIYFRDVSDHRALRSDGHVVHETADPGNGESTD